MADLTRKIVADYKTSTLVVTFKLFTVSIAYKNTNWIA